MCLSLVKCLNFGNLKYRIPPKFGILKSKILQLWIPKFGSGFPNLKYQTCEFQNLYQNPKIHNYKICIKIPKVWISKFGIVKLEIWNSKIWNLKFQNSDMNSKIQTSKHQNSKIINWYARVVCATRFACDKRYSVCHCFHLCSSSFFSRQYFFTHLQ